MSSIVCVTELSYYFHTFWLMSAVNKRARNERIFSIVCFETQVHHQNGFRGTPEQEIIAFQKQLQNLPDFDSPEHPTGITDPALAAAEFLASRGNRVERLRL